MTDGSSMAAGFWAGEFAVPARALLALGFTVDVATPGGAVPVPDTHSLSSGQSQHSLQQEFPALLHPLVLEDIDPTAAFDVGGAAALIIPGGYSPMVDLRSSAALSALLLGALERQLVIASICHGPSAFLSTLVEGEEWPFSGARMIAFTDEEEANWLRDRVSLLPWTVQSALEDAGADFQRSPGPWRSEVVVDSRLNLVTGQSSPSTQEWTQAILAAL
jgi:putative intracellular protease/amidase